MKENTYNYQARMIVNGKIIKEGKGSAKSKEMAYTEAHEGINPFSGVWVEIREVKK